MTRLLREAIATVELLPEEDQNAIAAELLAMVDEARASRPETQQGTAAPSVVALSSLDEAARAAVQEELAQADRGEFIGDDEVARFFKHHRG